MEHLQTASSAIQRALDELVGLRTAPHCPSCALLSCAQPAPSPASPHVQRKERDDASKREAELEVQLDAERESFAQREGALLDANEKLMQRTEELSDTVSRLQAQVSARALRLAAQSGNCGVGVSRRRCPPLPTTPPHAPRAHRTNTTRR